MRVDTPETDTGWGLFGTGANAGFELAQKNDWSLFGLGSLGAGVPIQPLRRVFPPGGTAGLGQADLTKNVTAGAVIGAVLGTVVGALIFSYTTRFLPIHVKSGR